MCWSSGGATAIQVVVAVVDMLGQWVHCGCSTGGGGPRYCCVGGFIIHAMVEVDVVVVAIAVVVPCMCTGHPALSRCRCAA